MLEGEPFVGDATFLEVVPLEGGFDFGFFALAIVMFELFARVCVEMCFLWYVLYVLRRRILADSLTKRPSRLQSLPDLSFGQTRLVKNFRI